MYNQLSCFITQNSFASGGEWDRILLFAGENEYELLSESSRMASLLFAIDSDIVTELPNKPSVL